VAGRQPLARPKPAVGQPVELRNQSTPRRKPVPAAERPAERSTQRTDRQQPGPVHRTMPEGPRT
jgi:hypothetical protein